MSFRTAASLIAIATVMRAACAEPAGAQTAPTAHSADAGWSVVGRQGIIQVVIVPVDRMHDKDAYLEQINHLCAPGQTCFINFYTNSTNAPLSLPLPDEVGHEATALFRRSVKQGAEMFEWSCRMATTDSLCF